MFYKRINQSYAPALLKRFPANVSFSGAFVGINVCKPNCRVRTCRCVVMSMCPPPQTMEVMRVVWQSLAPDGRGGRRWGGSLRWSRSRKPRGERRSDTRWELCIIVIIPQSVSNHLCLIQLGVWQLNVTLLNYTVHFKASLPFSIH